MSHNRSQLGGNVPAGGGLPGSTSADGEVRVGLTNLILGNGPEARQYGHLSRVQCFRFLNCCASLSVHGCREHISMERNGEMTILTRLLLSTRSVGRVVLSTRLLRQQRCAVV